jgi:hypothetical protein
VPRGPSVTAWRLCCVQAPKPVGACSSGGRCGRARDSSRGRAWTPDRMDECASAARVQEHCLAGVCVCAASCSRAAYTLHAHPWLVDSCSDLISVQESTRIRTRTHSHAHSHTNWTRSLAWTHTGPAHRRALPLSAAALNSLPPPDFSPSPLPPSPPRLPSLRL